MNQPATNGERGALLDRLSRRGKLTIEAADGRFDVRLEAHGPYVSGRCTIDKADLFEHCRLGAKNWHGDGPDLDALIVLCEMESRPDNRDVSELAWAIDYRRDTRTCGPPLPTYRRWYGWRPGHERWLCTSNHKYEYLGGYERDLAVERKFDEEQAEAEARRALPRVPRRVSHIGSCGGAP